MPSDIMDQRHISSFYRSSAPSSFFSEDAQFPYKKQLGFGKTASKPDHHGLEAMPLGGGKAVSSSPLENIRPFEGKFVDSLEFPLEYPIMGAGSNASCWRSPDQKGVSLSKLYGQPAPLSVEAKKVALNGGHYENGLFPSSLSNVFNKKSDEAFESLKETEAQTIRDLLPDDDDLLSGALHDFGYVAHSSRADVEDDLFCSVGGMELELDDNFIYDKSSEYDIGGAFNNGQGRGLDNLPASGPLQGEQSTRTLCVENIDSDIGDMELRALFEQFGDIQTFLTSCRHRGYIVVSYYDIRDAHNAKRGLQFKSIAGQEINIRFCISKDNHSESEINQGVLLVTNHDSSISNVDLLHLFGVYGEIKEICQIPLERHHTCIEFYDVRAAEAALSAINKCDITGGRIKVDPWDLREARLSLRQRLSLDLEEEESKRNIAESYSKKLPCFVPSGLIKLGANTSSDLHNEATQGRHTTFEIQNGPPMESKSSGISSSIPHNLSSPGLVAMVGNHYNKSNNYDNGHSIGRMNLGFENMPTFPEFHVFNVSGNGSFPLNGHEFIWNGSNAYHHRHPGSPIWQNLPPLVNNIPAQSPRVHGLARRPSHMLSPVFSPHMHVGSAPVVDPLLWNTRHATFTGDATSFDPSFLRSTRYSSCSQLQSLEHNIFPQTCIDPSIATSYVELSSPQRRGHMFRGRLPNSHDAPSDRIRSRRSDQNSNHADSRKQYELDIDRIVKGEDSRTTLMIKNIPNKYTSKMLMATIDEQHKGTYDFIYLPIDFKNKCNVGYAFINMTDPQHIIPFYQAFNGKKWEKFNSEKVAYLAYARIQGKTALIAHFQNSSLMNEDKRCRPVLFHSEGPNAGNQEPFPVAVNIRSRRSRARNENYHGSPSSSSSEGESSNSTGSTKDS